MKRDTILVHAGRDPMHFDGVVNTPVVRTSTVLYPTLEAYEQSRSDKFNGLRYGRYGTATAFSLEKAVCDLEGGHRSMILPSGLAAIAAVLRAFLRSGDHLLMVDSVYGPARSFCDEVLSQHGIETTYYRPSVGAGIEALVRDNTRAIYCESPGSLTFEVQDIPAIAMVAQRHEIPVICDNTWATPYFFRPFDHGANISIHAATKYIVGHSDAMLGIVVADERYWRHVRTSVAAHGLVGSPDDCFLALRGFRTLGVRLRQHQQGALAVAEWLQRHPLVCRVLSPMLPCDAGHELWRRDFTGASGLLGVELQPLQRPAILALFNTLKLFGIGSSWGGYESLILPANPIRSAPPREENRGTLLRLHIGLEDPEDLVADLQAGFRAAEAVPSSAAV